MSEKDLLEAMRRFVKGMMDEAEKQKKISRFTKDKWAFHYCDGSISTCKAMLQGLDEMEQDKNLMGDDE